MKLGVLFLVLAPALVLAADDSAAIRAVLEKQTADWNRGDIPAFVKSYAENCTFVGTAVTEGRTQLEGRYRRVYPNPAAMGQLTFSDLKIKKIDSHVAVVTGAYHLVRTEEGGGKKNGIFSLVLQLQGRVWHIVLDHTS